MISKASPARSTPRSAPKAGPPARRIADKGVRRKQLIEATMDSIAKRGFSDTTLSAVAKVAGLSQGIVNFHFKTKDVLFMETLRFLTEEYEAKWRAAVASGKGDAAKTIEALVRADFDHDVCNRKRVAVWYAFWGEAKSRPAYIKVCSNSDKANEEAFTSVFLQLEHEEGPGLVPAKDVASGLAAMINGFWQELMIGGARDFDRPAAMRTCFSYLAGHYPNCFGLEGVRKDRPTKIKKRA